MTNNNHLRLDIQGMLTMLTIIVIRNLYFSLSCQEAVGQQKQNYFNKELFVSRERATVWFRMRRTFRAFVLSLKRWAALLAWLLICLRAVSIHPFPVCYQASIECSQHFPTALPQHTEAPSAKLEPWTFGGLEVDVRVGVSVLLEDGLELFSNLKTTIIECVLIQRENVNSEKVFIISWS